MKNKLVAEILYEISDLLDIKGQPIHVRSSDQGKYEIGIQFTGLDQNTSRILKQFISIDETQHAPTAEEDE